MNVKLIAALACGAALALGACSGGAPATSTTPSTPDPTDPGTDPAEPGTDPAEPGTDDRTDAQKAFDTALTNAQTALETARMGVTSAKALADAADTAAKRTAATAALTAARTRLTAAVTTIRGLTAMAPTGDIVRRGRAEAAARDAGTALAADTAKLTAGEAAIQTFANAATWFRQRLARHTLGNGEAEMPSGGSREGAHVTIVRIPRTIDTSPTDDTQIANPKAFDEDTFDDHMYSAGDRAFSNSGDEFKVDGWVGWLASDWTLEEFTYTGLKLTDAGLVIRTGGTTATGFRGAGRYETDFTDMRRKITTYTNDGTGNTQPNTPFGQNGWDLVLTFGAPQTMSVPTGELNGNHRSDWTGNGNFHWRSLVPAADSQLETDGDYYASNAFGQAEGFRDLGTYDVWLSNYVGVNTNLEPVSSSAGDPYPQDDEPRYLKYAAYGLLLYTPDPETYASSFNGRAGRINTIHFGYSAFDAADGRRTTDIGEAITSGKFHGHTLAYETQGGRTSIRNTKLLRGDVTLTVNIPKGTGAGTLEGTMSNFQRWHDQYNYWTTYVDSFTIALSSATIGDDGTFIGLMQATPGTGLNTAGAGIFKGSFYGPRTDGDDLEIAGSWHIGAGFNTGYSNSDLVIRTGNLNPALGNLYGSFGAKQKPAATPASN